MEQTKIEVSKPILSPTRSLDEGFESDPDRISTDSELVPTQSSNFDLHNRHSCNLENSPISSICLDGGESESDNNADDGKLIMSNATIKPDQQPSMKLDQKQQQQQHMYRRVKNKAPLPPKSNSTNSIYQPSIQQRSLSVDRIQQRSSLNNDFNKSSSNANQNILAGRFVRVTVDPKQQYLNYFKNYRSYQNYHSNSSSISNTNSNSNSSSNSINGRLLGSTSNLYKSYHSSNSNKSSTNSSHETSGGLLSLSNLSSSMMPMQYGYSTVKAPKNYMHFAHPHHQHQQQPQSIQQSHFLASSWTQSMDPRKARKWVFFLTYLLTYLFAFSLCLSIFMNMCCMNSQAAEALIIRTDLTRWLFCAQIKVTEVSFWCGQKVSLEGSRRVAFGSFIRCE